MSLNSDFRTNLSSWRDIDGVEYELAIALGILEPGTPFATDAKHVFWSSNELGDALHDMLDMLQKIGALEYNGDEMQYRWNPRFNWRDVSSRKGR
jgi:hypothetical protein